MHVHVPVSAACGCGRAHRVSVCSCGCMAMREFLRVWGYAGLATVSKERTITRRPGDPMEHQLQIVVLLGFICKRNQKNMILKRYE